MASLEGKRILVTGASSGIGMECVRRLVQSGAEVVALARTESKLAQAFEGATGITTRAQDLADLDSYSQWVPTLGELDGVVHSAGETSFEPIRMAKPKKMESLLAINLLSPIFLTREMLVRNVLRKNASVVFISSVATQHPGRTQMLYAAAKAGLMPACRAFVSEFTATTGVRFNCVSLGMVDTPMLEENRRCLGDAPFERESNRYPLGTGKPADAASLIEFLISDESRWIAGSEWLADGGRSCSET